MNRTKLLLGAVAVNCVLFALGSVMAAPGWMPDSECNDTPAQFPKCSDVGGWYCVTNDPQGGDCINCSSSDNFDARLCTLLEDEWCYYDDTFNCGARDNSECLFGIGGWACLPGLWDDGACTYTTCT